MVSPLLLQRFMRNPTYLFAATTAAALSFIVLPPLQGIAEEKSLEEQIQSITSPVSKVASQAEAAAGLRVDKYLRDLRKLETEIATGSGNLDHVLAVKQERESWEKGVETDAVDPKDEKLPLEFRKLRYYYDEDRNKLSAEVNRVNAEALTLAINQLTALEQELTKNEKIDEAISVRAARTQLEKRASESANLTLQWVGSRTFTIVDFGYENETDAPASLRDQVKLTANTSGNGVDLEIPLGVFVILESVQPAKETEQLVGSFEVSGVTSTIDVMVLAKWKEPEHANGGRSILPPWPQNRPFNSKLGVSAPKAFAIPVDSFRLADGRVRVAIGSQGWQEGQGSDSKLNVTELQLKAR